MLAYGRLIHADLESVIHALTAHWCVTDSMKSTELYDGDLTTRSDPRAHYSSCFVAHDAFLLRVAYEWTWGACTEAYRCMTGRMKSMEAMKPLRMFMTVLKMYTKECLQSRASSHNLAY